MYEGNISNAITFTKNKNKKSFFLSLDETSISFKYWIFLIIFVQQFFSTFHNDLIGFPSIFITGISFPLKEKHMLPMVIV